MKMFKSAMTLASVVALPAFAGLTSHCKNGKVERTIEVVHTTEGKKIPCEVKYTKDGESKVLWSAAAKEGYCEEKATEFAAKLTGTGWTCTSEGQN